MMTSFRIFMCWYKETYGSALLTPYEPSLYINEFQNIYVLV